MGEVVYVHITTFEAVLRGLIQLTLLSARAEAFRWEKRYIYI